MSLERNVKIESGQIKANDERKYLDSNFSGWNVAMAITHILDDCEIFPNPRDLDPKELYPTEILPWQYKTN